MEGRGPDPSGHSLEELRNTTKYPRKKVVVPANIKKGDWANLLTESGNAIMLNA
jgi:hypothetical protein